MNRSILYCGDTSLATAASYLGGVMAAAGLEFDYRASDQVCQRSDLDDRQLVILSDYPAARMPVEVQTRLVEMVAAGTGLLMVGGWESFHGLGGDWDGTSVAACLPVEIAKHDDRRNCDHVVVVRAPAKAIAHPVCAGLPWTESPPVIGGFNQFQAKPGGETLLIAEQFAPVSETPDLGLAFRVLEKVPLLVVGRFGAGRVAALGTDLAPHWCGPLVDWGARTNHPRLAARAPGAEAIEVGGLYAQFVRQLVTWTRGG